MLPDYLTKLTTPELTKTSVVASGTTMATVVLDNTTSNSLILPLIIVMCIVLVIAIVVFLCVILAVHKTNRQTKRDIFHKQGKINEDNLLSLSQKVKLAKENEYISEKEIKKLTPRNSITSHHCKNSRYDRSDISSVSSRNQKELNSHLLDTLSTGSIHRCPSRLENKTESLTKGETNKSFQDISVPLLRDSTEDKVNSGVNIESNKDKMKANTPSVKLSQVEFENETKTGVVVEKNSNSHQSKSKLFYN